MAARATPLAAAVALAACSSAVARTEDAGAAEPRPVQRAALSAARSGAANGALVRPAARGPVTWAGDYAGGGQLQRGALAVHLVEGPNGGLAGGVAFRATPASDTFTPVSRKSDASVVVRARLAEVRRDAERVVLVTEPYYDPRCGCTATLTFAGTTRGDTLSGRYVLDAAATSAGVRGRWRVVRRAAGPSAGATPGPVADVVRGAVSAAP